MCFWIKKFRENDDDKYNGECDKKDPKIKITFPKNKQNVSGPTVVITGTASDKDSGIKKVQVKVDNGPYQDAIFSGGGMDIYSKLRWGQAQSNCKSNRQCR